MLLGVEGFRTDRVHRGNTPSGPVCLDRSGGTLPPFNSADALGKWSQDGRRVLRTAVGGGLAEPVLVTTETSVQLGPPLDLSLVTPHPGIASPLCGSEGPNVHFGFGPAMFPTQRIKAPEVGVSKLARNVGRSA